MKVAECLAQLVAEKTISAAVANEAGEFFNRSQAEWSREMGPASAEAAAALETAKKMRDKAAERQIAIAQGVKTYQTMERRIVDDPRGGRAALAGALTKDTLIGDKRLNALRKSDPAHPIFSGGNADYLGTEVKRKLFGMLGPELESFKTGLLKSKQALLSSATDFIRERFGVDTGNGAAKAVSDGFGKMVDYAAGRAKAAGKIFSELEDWRLPQHWVPDRVGRVSEEEYVRDHMAEISNGGLKLFDKETNRYAKADRYEDMLKKAYSDIKNEGGRDAPFSKNGRTFEFQPGEAGAQSWLKLQAKYGVGNEIMATVANHIDHMARTIALHEIFGPNPDATFAAAMRSITDKNPGSPLPKGLGWLTSDNALRNTFDLLAGRGHPTANEAFARFMAGTRDMIGMASLRNLPITIMPGDSLMTLLAANFHGMSGFNVLAHVFDGKMTREIAAHLQVSAHGHMDFVNNFVRRYEDELNVSGLIRKASRGVVKATGADWWTTNGRLSTQVSYLNQIAGMRDLAFDKLDPKFRNQFLGYYGFTADDWDKIRASPTWDAPNGAKYLDPTQMDQRLSERLMMAIKEQSSFMFHEPDARTTAIMRGGVKRGTLAGEMWLSAGQYKQFTMERMTTHIMRILMDDSGSRFGRGAAFTLLSMAAGAVSLQAAAAVSGKSPLDMTSPKFWVEALTRGGGGGLFGDMVSAAMHGERGGLNMAAQLAGPLPGFAGDVASVLVNPARRILDESGRSRATWGGDIANIGRRWTPNTWYTKLAVDRLLWDKAQILIDPNYRQSFRRAEQRARKENYGFWWGPGEPAPSGLLH